MASPFAAAIVQSITESIGPNAHLDSEVIQGYLDQQKAQVKVTKANAAERIASLLTEAKLKGADQVVITTYQKLLSQLSE